MVRFKAEIRGIEEVQRELGRLGAKRLEEDINDNLSDGINGMAKQSHDYAPVETGALKESILASVRKDGNLEYIYGSHLPYAQRQEYEHKTKKAYFRRAVWGETPKIEKNIKLSIRRRGG